MAEMKNSTAASSRWTKSRLSHFFPSYTNSSGMGAASTDQSSTQGEELHHRKHCEEDNDGQKPKKSPVSTSTMQIKSRQDEDEDDGRIVIKPVNDEDDTSVIITFNQSISPFIITLTFVASISGFMFGYDTGYISSALISINRDLDNKVLTYGEKELITAATSLGALITSVGAGTAADVFGRRPCLMFSNLMFLIGAILQITAHKFWQMAAGRLIMGFGVGVGSLISPLFISEIAPKMIRGRLTVINSLWLTGGQLIAYGCGAGLNHVKNGWRILVGLSLIPTVLQFSFFCFLPDTPRYYVMKGDLKRAKMVLKRSYVNTEDEIIDQKVEELSSLNQSIPGKNPITKFWNMVKELYTVPSYFRALIIGCGLQAIQQFTGWNSLMYFSGTIFETVGFKNSSAVSIIVSGTNFVFTLIAFFCIDKIGRRYILLIGLPGMTVALVICAIAFHFLGIKFNGADAVVASDGFSSWGIVIIVFIIVYAAFYALGIGTVPWQQSELFPQNVRGVGTSYATATNWAGSLVIASTFLTMLQNITPTGTFSFFAGVACLSTIFCYFCYPELSGLELEEVQTILKDGFNIKASKALAKKRKQQVAEGAAHHKLKFEPTQEIVES
ncbi:AVN_HP_G0073470.mRNA.1.CDS.1 [Saccharomyces cerevisiae]|nr:AVN_HP_G0145930.mRNA.1.CDS.1 [Saccharomyces cerevisiae]CAI5033970.1 AVN_HP_G0073470.mRNA.1.CDS.1 [Saccharomyces cerevisiae]CAI6513968.1 AVN_HP_G0145930.mRNA.1.CDS.1 [Saccharomyces cerevisiae]CAI6950442.1 AVN_HP_G0073470.mRNA.1.CDS.1 [Saccharomyces cerevisiae]